MHHGIVLQAIVEYNRIATNIDRIIYNKIGITYILILNNSIFDIIYNNHG